jgi:hypothetical protein
VPLHAAQILQPPDGTPRQLVLCTPMRDLYLQAASPAEMGSWAADIRALLSAGRHSQTDGEGDGRSSQAEARRSIAEVPRARRSSIHSTAL